MQGMVPRIQVYYDHMQSWWQLPDETGYEIYWNLKKGIGDLTYSSETGKGKKRKLSEYELDFSTMSQRSLETKKIRPMQMLWTTPRPGQQHQLDVFNNWLSERPEGFELSRLRSS